MAPLPIHQAVGSPVAPVAVIEVGSSTDRSARREKSVDLVPLSDAAIRLVAVLRDTSVAVDDPTDVELIHDLRIEASVSVPDLVITDVTGHAEQQPYDRCASPPRRSPD